MNSPINGKEFDKSHRHEQEYTHWSLMVLAGLMGVASQTILQVQASSNNNDNGNGNGNDNDNDRNLLHDLGDAANEAGDGNEAGREAARNDFNSGRSHNDFCPRPGEMAWCGGYIVGYNAVWLALKSAQN